MERYLLASAPTTSATFYEEGVAVDPGVVTLTITREDGTVIATGTGTSGTGAAARTFNMSAVTHLSQLDVLRLDWFSATKGTITTYIDVAGGFLFSVAALRATPPLTDTSKYPAADLITARVLAESALEEACGVPFVPRYFREKLDGRGSCDVLLPPRPLTVAAATVGGTALTVDELAALELYEDGRVYRSTGWARGRRNIELRGTRGYKFPPPRVGRACLLLAKRWLVDTPISDRATSITNDDGATTYMLTAGIRDLVFDVPEALAVVQGYGLDHGIA